MRPIKYRQFYEGQWRYFGSISKDGGWTNPRSTLFSKYPAYQSTNMYDVSGVEIYEGDSVYSDTLGESEVEFISGKFMCTFTHRTVALCDLLSELRVTDVDDGALI